MLFGATSPVVALASRPLHQPSAGPPPRAGEDMTPAARLQAAIELLDAIIASARDGGPAADTLIARYFKERRYAGSRDRRAVRDHVYDAIRRAGERPDTGREAMIGLAQ